jgi:hypothetical protein
MASSLGMILLGEFHHESVVKSENNVSMLVGFPWDFGAIRTDPYDLSPFMARSRCSGLAPEQRKL